MSVEIVSEPFVRLVGKNNSKHKYVICRCECGREFPTNLTQVKSGKTKSCGCQRRPKPVHGMAGTRIYGRWMAMKERCRNPKNIKYSDYGGRGITVCERWCKFENFLADVGDIPPGMELGRIDNNGNYEPKNVRLATRKQQMNNSRANRIVVVDGESMTFTQCFERNGLRRGTVTQRLRYGWTERQALGLEPPPFHKKRRRIITVYGVSASLSEWCEKLNLKYKTICGRINDKGWTEREALGFDVRRH